MQIRSTINQRLLFNASIIFPALRNGLFPVFFKGQTAFTEDQFDVVRNAYNLLNALFRGNRYLVGDNITVADLCTIVTVSQIELILPLDDEKYPKVRQWIKRMEMLPYYDELNRTIIEEFRPVLMGAMNKNKEAAEKA